MGQIGKVVSYSQATRLQMKDLEDRLRQLQQNIGRHGIGIGQDLDKDILKIVGEQSIEATPQLKFLARTDEAETTN